MKNYIEQITIDNLPFVMVNGLSDDENRYVNEWIKYALQYAKDYNNSDEVGVILNMSNWEDYDMVLGNEYHVVFNTDKMREWFDKGNNNLILIHNHPSNHIFSDKDIFNFCKTVAVNTIIVIGNKGTVYLLQKLNGFDKYKLIQYYSDLTYKNKLNFSRGKILELTLEEYQSALNIKFVREE
jgi:hypothetical protein